jgi:hypothetical protein
MTPGLCPKLPPRRGRRECRAPGAPAAACAKVVSKKAHALVRSHRKHPALPTQWFTAYFALSPVIGLFCHRHEWRLRHSLDTSVEASGPHDFAVRLSAVRQRHIRVHRIPPRVRDDRDTPLEWDEMVCVIDVICISEKQNIFASPSGQVESYGNCWGISDLGAHFSAVIPGRCEASNPESRDSGSGAGAPSRNDGLIWLQPKTLRPSRVLENEQLRDNRDHAQRSRANGAR